MKFIDFKKQVIDATRKALEAEKTGYEEISAEEPEGTYEYRLMLSGGLIGVVAGVQAMIEIADITDRQKELLKDAIGKLRAEYKN